jgi:hypothetical protein
MPQDVEGNEKSYAITLREVINQISAPAHVQIRVLADYCTVEPSGAATFWIRSPDGMRSALVMAISKDDWIRIELAS